MSDSPPINPKLRLLNSLKRNEGVIGTFTVLKGVRNAQVLAHTGVDVSSSPEERGRD